MKKKFINLNIPSSNSTIELKDKKENIIITTQKPNIYTKKKIKNKSYSTIGNNSIQSSFSISNKKKINETIRKKQFEKSNLNNNSFYNLRSNFNNSFFTQQPSFINLLEENNEFVNLIKEFRNLSDNEDFINYLLNENIEKEKKDNFISVLNNLIEKTKKLQTEIKKKKKEIEEQNINNNNNIEFDNSISSLSDNRLTLYNKIFSTIFNGLNELETSDISKEGLISKPYSTIIINNNKNSTKYNSRSSSFDENDMMRKSIDLDSQKNINLNFNLNVNNYSRENCFNNSRKNSNKNNNRNKLNSYNSEPNLFSKNNLNIGEEIEVNQVNKYSFVVDKKNNGTQLKRIPIKKGFFSFGNKFNNYLTEKNNIIIDDDDEDFTDLDLSEINENNENDINNENVSSIHQTPNRLSKKILFHNKFENKEDIIYRK